MNGLRALLVGAAPADPPTITIDPGAWRLYRESIACNPPETVALIAGRLDNPLHITDFFFMAPPRQGGTFDHGTAHVALDAMAMNYVVDRVLMPNGKYMLGLWHSHPGGYTAPSEPDRRLCAAILRNDDSSGRRWEFFIAPITTFDADGRDRVTAWVMRKGTDTFEPAVLEPSVPTPVALPVPVPEVPAVMPPPPVALPAVTVTEAPGTDPLAVIAAQLGAVLAGPDGPVGVPRHRIGACLRSALTIAECGGDAAFRS